ncbi:GDSL-like Lipase/Acylhydrolase family protein [Ruminococcus sp. YRD2003]|uniref:GDSL-type esterase/lipase family protein n=1 Tax=Ruminococcus sp. YRD2003 TaxID=1452313 RepID=UPI0008B3027B|nr:GDSL-like Lipase/Acylhydrolase family protein [Ruminococcus flavefaciens]
MKKILSAIMSAAIAVSAALPFSGTAAAAEDISSIVVLGDSIASGYGLAEGEKTYGEIVGNYYGAKTDNYAKSGDATTDLIAALESPTTELSASIKGADYVIVSVGGNDMLQYASNYLLKVCANVGVLKSGYTKADIPEKPTFADLDRLVDREALKTYASENPVPMNSNIQKLRGNMVFKKADHAAYDCIIETRVIPNIKKINADIEALNPEAKVVYQTIYDPAQFEEEYYKATYTGNALKVMNLLRPVFGAVTESFREQLMEADLGGALIADVYTDFTSLDDSGAKYSWYFTNMQRDRSEMDFHPTQAGHVAIAAKVIDTIGTKDKGGDLIVQTYDKLADKAGYPAAALATYNKVAATTAPEESGIKLGDPNGDGNIDAKDSSFILTAYSKSSTGADTGLSAEQKKAANVNGDALIDAKDASAILGYYSYISTGGTKSLPEYLA